MNDPVAKQQLMKEIFGVTAMIQTDFPAQYKHLDETPLFFNDKRGGLTYSDFEQYRETLKLQWITLSKGTTVPENRYESEG